MIQCETRSNSLLFKPKLTKTPRARHCDRNDAELVKYSVSLALAQDIWAIGDSE